MNTVTLEYVTSIQPSSSTFLFISTPSLSIAHVEMTSMGPNLSLILTTTLEESPLAVDLVGQVDGPVWGNRRQRGPEQTEASQVDHPKTHKEETETV